MEKEEVPNTGNLLRDFNTYRGVSLLSVSGKVLNRVNLEKMREAIDVRLRD